MSKLTGDPQKFRDPAEALNYLLSDVPKRDLSCTNVDMGNQNSPAHSSVSIQERSFHFNETSRNFNFKNLE